MTAHFDPTETIDLSVTENRTVVLYPDTAEEASEMLDALGAYADSDCDTWQHISGAGYSGPEAVGYYHVWGDEDNGRWSVHVIAKELG